MKKSLISLMAVLVTGSALAAGSSAASILRLLNTQRAGSAKSYEDARKAVFAEARAGKPVQQFVYGVLFPQESWSKDFKEMSRAKIHDLAEEKNNALAWYLLALENQDTESLRKSADLGNVQALNTWATIMINEASASKDMSREDRDDLVKQGFECFKRASAKKDANGFFNLGTCYMAGIGCARDGQLGLAAFQSAAELGHPEAINNIGGCYRDGVMVEKNLAKAAQWFRKSAEIGNEYGMLNYGLALVHGEGVSKDEKLGVKYLTDAASLGNAEAMECLATCAEKGVGMPVDAQMSTVWTVRARAARGSESAMAWLKENGYK